MTCGYLGSGSVAWGVGWGAGGHKKEKRILTGQWNFFQNYSKFEIFHMLQAGAVTLLITVCSILRHFILQQYDICLV